MAEWFAKQVCGSLFYETNLDWEFESDFTEFGFTITYKIGRKKIKGTTWSYFKNVPFYKDDVMRGYKECCEVEYEYILSTYKLGMVKNARKNVSRPRGKKSTKRNIESN